MNTDDEEPWFEHPDLIEFYLHHRDQPADLYPSERRSLLWLASQATSVLDLGCATGGFSNIWRSFQPGVVYTGVDLSPSQLGAARVLHPDDTFVWATVRRDLRDIPPTSDAVQAFGWLH